MTAWVFGEVTKHVVGAHVWYSCRFEMDAGDGRIPRFWFCAARIGGDQLSYTFTEDNIVLNRMMLRDAERAIKVVRYFTHRARQLIDKLKDMPNGVAVTEIWESSPTNPEYIQVVEDALNCIPLAHNNTPTYAEA